MRSTAEIDGELAECRQRITELETERRQAAEAERRQEIEQQRLDEADAAVLQRLEDGDDLCVRPPTGGWWVRLGEMVERAGGQETAAADRLYQRGLVALERRSIPAAGLTVAIYTVRDLEGA